MFSRPFWEPLSSTSRDSSTFSKSMFVKTTLTAAAALSTGGRQKQFFLRESYKRLIYYFMRLSEFHLFEPYFNFPFNLNFKSDG